MRTFKVIALSAILVIATAGLALACDGQKAENAAAKASSCDSKVEATTAAAKAGGCDKAEATNAAAEAASCNKAEATTAAAKAGCDKAEATNADAKAGCDASAKAAKTASAEAGCSSSAAAVKTASAEGGCSSNAAAVKTASASCDAEKAKMAQSIQVETVRMPSGAMAVFYNGTCEKSTAYLQTAAADGCEGFVCNLAKGMAADEDVMVEMAKTEHGVMILVSAEKAEKVDEYEAKYAMAVASSSESSEE